MKQKKYQLTALLLTAALLTGCGQQIPNESSADSSTPQSSSEPESSQEDSSPTNDEDEVIELDENTVVVTTPDGSIIVETDSGCQWSYLGGTCILNFPAEWKDRYVVRGTSVYSKKCYEAEKGSGELFSLQFVNEATFVQESKPAVLIGMVRKMYAVTVVPDNPKFDADNADLKAEYEDMAAALPEVFRSAVCGGNTAFTPIDLADYVPAADSADNALTGTWNTSGSADTAVPFVTFRSRDSAFGYRYAQAGVVFGSFLLDKNGSGDTGLVFADGCVLRTAVSADTVTFELLLESKESSDTLGGQSFKRSSDAEEIYQSDNDTQELEFT